MILLHPVQSPQYFNHVNEQQCRLYLSRQSKPHENCLLPSKVPDNKFKKIKLQSKVSSLMPMHRIAKKQRLTEGPLLTIYLLGTLQKLLSKSKAILFRRRGFLGVSPQDNLSHKQPSQGSAAALQTLHYPAYSTRYYSI